MVWRVTVLVVLLSAYTIDGSFYCARRGMCSGVMQYGDNRCYRPGQLMEYRDRCVMYICKKMGNFYLTDFYKTGCNYRGRCYQNRQSYMTRRGFGYCTYMTCHVTRNMWQMVTETRRC